jgi:hypothetical protein
MNEAYNTIIQLAVVFTIGCGGTLGDFDEDATTDPTPDPTVDTSVDFSPDPVGDPTPDPTPDPTVDTAPDPVPDPTVDTAPDPTTDTTPAGGCADGSEEDTFGATMVGCAGHVGWPERDTLCAPGWSACTAAEWVARRAGAAPGHIYWTDDDLRWSGSGSGDCEADTSGGNWCGTNVPMRVCSDHDDAESNVCNWTHCGLDSREDEWFGGCQDNPTAGTLCCR